MLMQDQYLYKSPAVEVYGHYFPVWGCLVDFFAIWGWKIPGTAVGDWTHNPLDLCSQSGPLNQSANNEYWLITLFSAPG